MCSLSGKVIGGHTIQAEVLTDASIELHRITPFTLLTESAYEDELWLGETKADIAALAGCFGRVICIKIDLELKVTSYSWMQQIRRCCWRIQVHDHWR